MQMMTAICLFEAVLRSCAGICRDTDHLLGPGAIQNVDDDEMELEDEDEDDAPEGNSKLRREPCDGVAISFGDLSTKGSRDGELNNRQTVRSRNPIVSVMRDGD